MVISNDVRVKCSKQTEDLFDCFLKINEYEEAYPQKRKSREFSEVQKIPYGSGLQRDNGKTLLSGNFTEITGLSPCLARSSGPCDNNFLSKTVPSKRSLKNDDFSLQRSSSSSSINSSIVLTAQSNDFELQSNNLGPTEEQIKETALEIARIGDKIQEEYEQKFRSVERNLVGLLNEQGTELSYDAFAVYFNNLIGENRNVDNFILLLHLSKRVINETQRLGTSVVSYFRQFVGTAFADEVAMHDNVVQFVHSHGI